MDQDQFEATGFAYRMIEELGFHAAPAFLIERVRTGGQWLDGPVLGNLYPGWLAEALSYGVPDVSLDDRHLYTATRDHLAGILGADGRWPRIAPREVERDTAPVKEVVRHAAEADLLRFPWLQTNPGDAGPYITAGTVFMEDPELGRNVATYRCQVKGARKIGVNCEIGQHGWNFIQRAKNRGEATLPAAVVIGVDPITFSIGTSKLAGLGEDELEVAGGLRRTASGPGCLRDQPHPRAGSRRTRHRGRDPDGPGRGRRPLRRGLRLHGPEEAVEFLHERARHYPPPQVRGSSMPSPASPSSR